MPDSESSKGGSLLRHAPALTLVLIATLLFPPAGLTQDKENKEQAPEFRIQVDVLGAPVNDKSNEKNKDRNKDQWIEVRSKNFQVVGDADENDLKLAASELELFRDQFARFFPRATGSSSVPTRVVVFRESGVLNLTGPGDSDQTRVSEGYLRTGDDITYIVLTAGERISRALIRSYVRLLMKDSMSPLPLWFEEGLAEYFSAYKLTRLGDSRLIKFGLDDYKGKLREKTLVPFKTLFSLDGDAFKKMDSSAKTAFYAQSCAAIHHLLHTRRLGVMLRLINATAEGMTLDQAFLKVLNMPLAVFDENLKHHLHILNGEGWPATFVGLALDPNKKTISILYANERVPLQIPANFDSVRSEVNALPVHSLSKAQTEFHFGDLLLHNDRPAEAETHYRSALQMEPQLAAATASLAISQALQHEYVSARGSIDKALDLNPGDYLAQYYSGRILYLEGAERGVFSDLALEAMSSALAKSVELAPEFVPAAELLAETQVRFSDDIGAAIRLLLDALKRSPGRHTLLMALARAAAEGGQDSTAGWVLHRVIAGGGADAEMKKEARDLLEQLVLTVEEQTAFGDIAVDETPDPQGVEIRLSGKPKDEPRKKDEVKIFRGLLTKLECSKGLTLHIRKSIEDRIENLHTDAPERILWITDDGQTLDAVECGPTIKSGSVAITYRPARKGSMMGEPLVVEFCRSGSLYATDCKNLTPR